MEEAEQEQASSGGRGDAEQAEAAEVVAGEEVGLDAGAAEQGRAPRKGRA